MSAYTQQGIQQSNNSHSDQTAWQNHQPYLPSPGGQWSGHASAYGHSHPDMYNSQPPLPSQTAEHASYAAPGAYSAQGPTQQAGYTNHVAPYSASSVPLPHSDYGSLYAANQNYYHPSPYNGVPNYSSGTNPPLPPDAYPPMPPSQEAASPSAPPLPQQPPQSEQAYHQAPSANPTQYSASAEQPYNPYTASQPAMPPWSQPYPGAPPYDGSAAYQHSAAYPNTAAYPQAGLHSNMYHQPEASTAYQAGTAAVHHHAATYEPASAGFQSAAVPAASSGYNGAYTYQPGAAPFQYPAQQPQDLQYQSHAVGLPPQPGVGEGSHAPPMLAEQHSHTAAASGLEAEQHTQESAPLPALPPTDALDIFSGAGRTTRPKAIAVIVRGIPGSGKSFIAAKLRKLEIDAGGQPPRVHSIDAYFMNEVEQACDAGPGRGKRTVKVEEYEYDAKMEAAYEESLLKAFARTMAEGQHPIVIVDAPLLSAARLHDFRVAAQAAGFEVYVTQSPVQDPQECYKRNIHQRTYVDIQRSKSLFEATPPSMSTLDISRVLEGGAPAPVLAKRKSSGDSAADGGRLRAAAPPASAPEGSPGPKRQKGGPGVDDRDLLAAIDKGFMRMDESDGEPGSSAATASRPPKASAPKSRWEDSDDEDDAAPAPAPAANGARNPSAADAKLQELMSAHARVTKKTVRWPDQEPDDDDVDAFRIGRPRQLETIHYIEGLGPQSDEAERPALLSFSQAARAEHDSERQKHIAGGWSLT